MVDPVVDWSDVGQWEAVYRPSSDTFFLCDGVKQLEPEFPVSPTIFEIGSGSGYVSAYTRRLLMSMGKSSFHFSTDINLKCCLKTKEICEKNNVQIMAMRDCFASNFRGIIDILIFNPPYVETSKKELNEAIEKRSIEASWAGGVRGAEVIYDCLRFIVQNIHIFSNDFMFILLLDQINSPSRISKWCQSNGLKMMTILKKNCQGEMLLIVKIQKQ